VGEATWPYEWAPSIVETQILRIGNLFVIGIPGELTTMAGRRLRRVVEAQVKAGLPEGSPEPHVVIAGLSNVYTHYIATFEEYQKQRYEAASTLYGPHTLDAYLQHYPTLVDALLKVSAEI
jgi:neutral ceramidase